MSKTSSTNNAIRGGQQFTLELNMFVQNFKNHAKLIGLLSLIVFIVSAYFIQNPIDRKWTKVWALSYVNTQVLKGNADKTYQVDNGRNPIVLTWAQYYKNPSIIQKKDNLISDTLYALGIAIVFTIFIVVSHVKYIIRKGAKATENQHVRGANIDEHTAVKAALNEIIKGYKKERGSSFLNLFGMPMIQGSECAGIAFSGSPGVGKSTEMFAVASQFRKAGKKMIVYDIGGEFVARFYREGKDKILNPFDRRSVDWDLWSEGTDLMTYTTICNALIPETKSGDPVWYTAPRNVLSHVISEVGMRSTTPDIATVLRIIYRMDTKSMAKVLRDTDANAMFNTEAEKFASSIRGIIGTYTHALRYLKSSSDTFSIRDWVKDDNDDSWVFVSTTAEQADTLAPLMTVWFEIFSKAMLSIKPDYERKIGLGLDELTTLNEIPSLMNAINLGRKYGLVPLLGFQSYYLLADKYGENRAKSLLDAMTTYAAFRCNGDDGANAAAKQLGKQEVEQGTESYTVGQAAMRDATNVNRQAKDERNLILGSEIQALQDEECYVNFHRGIPIAKLKASGPKPKPIQPEFIDNGRAIQIDTKTLDPLEQVDDIDAYLDRLEEEVKAEAEAEKEAAITLPTQDAKESATNLDNSTFIS